MLSSLKLGIFNSKTISTHYFQWYDVIWHQPLVNENVISKRVGIERNELCLMLSNSSRLGKCCRYLNWTKFSAHKNEHQKTFGYFTWLVLGKLSKTLPSAFLKVKEKKSHIQTPKPPFLDFSPLRSSTVRMLCILAAVGAFGCYTPVFFLVNFLLFHWLFEFSPLFLHSRFTASTTATTCKT